MITVVGMGKMGLPLACQYASRGHQVIGCDVSVRVVSAVNSGECPVEGEAELPEALQAVVADGALEATTDTPGAVAESDVVVVIVPLGLRSNGEPDYAKLEAATQSIGRGLRPGSTVVYETTVAVGDTRHRFRPLLDEVSGLRGGTEYHLAFSPERVFMGRIFSDLKNYPKVVGGINAASTEQACKFYRSVLDGEVIPVSDSETAEFVKLAETTYRDVNIALANELALGAVGLGVDAVRAFELANTQPYAQLHTPGGGVGGHCIPVYPKLLLSRLPQLRMPALAREINGSMPGVAVSVVWDALAGVKDRVIAVLGLSYREDVKESTLSPALEVVSRLSEAGARVAIRDPWYTPEELLAVAPEVVVGTPIADATIIMAKHSAFRGEDLGRGGIIVDCRPGGWKPRTEPGQKVYVFGRGWQ